MNNYEEQSQRSQETMKVICQEISRREIFCSDLSERTMASISGGLRITQQTSQSSTALGDDDDGFDIILFDIADVA